MKKLLIILILTFFISQCATSKQSPQKCPVKSKYDGLNIGDTLRINGDTVWIYLGVAG